MAEKVNGTRDDHFSTEFAPVNRPRHAMFGAVDAVMLIVLALEGVAVMRLLLAT